MNFLARHKHNPNLVRINQVKSELFSSPPWHFCAVPIERLKCGSSPKHFLAGSHARDFLVLFKASLFCLFGNIRKTDCLKIDFFPLWPKPLPVGKMAFPPPSLRMVFWELCFFRDLDSAGLKHSTGTIFNSSLLFSLALIHCNVILEA